MFTCKYGDNFIEPLVTVKVGKVEKPANTAGGSLALNLAYVVMSMTGDAKKFDDLTKRNAGTVVLPWLKALEAKNPDATFTFYHPKEQASLRQWDVTKWTAIESSPVADMVKVAEVLAKVDTLLNNIQPQILEVVSPVLGITPKVINVIPSTGKAKRTGGSKTFAPIEF